MTITYEEVLELFRQVAESQKETDREFKEMREESKARSREIDREFKEMREESKARSQELDRRFQETDKLIKALSKNLGEIGNRLGEFVEHMVMPSAVRLFQAQGLDVHEVYAGVTVKREGQGIEVDLLVVNDGTLIAIECKSKMTTAYIDAHVERMSKLKKMLPLYRHHRALGAVAAMVMPPSVAQYAEEQGFYAILQSGDAVTVYNQPTFQAKAW